MQKTYHIQLGGWGGGRRASLTSSNQTIKPQVVFHPNLNICNLLSSFKYKKYVWFAAAAVGTFPLNPQLTFFNS